MNKILLIGGNGFIGGYLTKALSTTAECSISVVDRLIPDEKSKISGVEYHKIDLSHKDARLESIFQDKDIIVIMTQPGDGIIENIIYYLGLAKDIKKVVYISSVLIYPDSPVAQDETVKPDPLFPYEKGKAREEALISKFCHDLNIKLCIPRLSNVYGDIKNVRIVGFIFGAAIGNTFLNINGDGEQVRDYIFIEDTVRFLGFLIFFQQRSQTGIFNICTSTGHTINEIISEAESIIGHEILCRHGPPVPEKRSVIGDNHKILTISGISIKYDLNAGFRKTYANHLKTPKWHDLIEKKY